MQTGHPDWVLVRDSGVDAGGGTRQLSHVGGALAVQGGLPGRLGAFDRQAPPRRRAPAGPGSKKRASAFDDLSARLLAPKARIRTIEAALRAANDILAETSTVEFFELSLTTTTEPTFRQESRGRPGDDTRYRRTDRTRIALSFEILADKVTAQAASDGMYPFITNDRDLSPGDLLEHYKYQPCLERRHEQLKTGLAVVPIWLKSINRIEAILLLYYIALLVRALIEREIRRNMKEEDIASLPMYPEDRNCPAPSAERILAIFSDPPAPRAGL